MGNRRIMFYVLLSMVLSLCIAIFIGSRVSEALGILAFFVAMLLMVGCLRIFSGRSSAEKQSLRAHKALMKKVSKLVGVPPPEAEFTAGAPSDLRSGLGGAVVLGLIDGWESSGIRAMYRIPELLHPDEEIRSNAFDYLKKTLRLSTNLLSHKVSKQYSELLDYARYYAERCTVLEGMVAPIAELKHLVDHPYG